MADTLSNDDRVAQIRDRATASLKFMTDNYYPKWSEAFRNYKCLTLPIYTIGPDGKETTTEDKSRTNVAMPTPNKIVRTNVARLTAQPPTIGYRCSNPEVAAKLTAWSFMQYDRSGESKEHRRVVHQGELLGWSVSKLIWDEVILWRKFQKQIIKDNAYQFTDRSKLMGAVGMPQEQIDQSMEAAKQNYGNDYADQMHPDEMAQFTAQYGDSIGMDQRIRKYEGPIARFVFAGDLLWEPGCLELNLSEWAIQNYVENELWLAKMVKQTYDDPETGDTKPVFDSKVCDQLISDNPGPRERTDTEDLKKLFHAAIAQETAIFDKKLMGKKRFDVSEQHEIRPDGKAWITYVANGKYFLGEMPYPFDLYGKYVYTEYVPMPDIISNVGDSTVILGRHLHALDNANEGQKTDLINRALRPTGVMEKIGDVPPETVKQLGSDYIVGKGLSAQNFLPVPQVPPAAWEQTANIQRRWSQLDPALNNIEAGTQFNPQAGKTATTAVLQAKAADVLTQDKVACLNLYLKEVGEKKLWMLQAAAPGLTDPIEVPSRYIKDEALSSRYGKTAAITIDPYEIQEDIEVEPEAGSMLSVDDELNKDSAKEFYIAALSNPTILDVRYAAQKYAATIRNVDPTKALLPPPPPVEDAKPETKVNVSVSVKWGELVPAVQEQILAGGGLQITPDVAQQMQADSITRALPKWSEAADAATNMTAEAHPQPEPKVPGGLAK